MKVVLLSEVFARPMGYLENLLPKYLARLGANVHVIAMDLPPYYQAMHFNGTRDKTLNRADLLPGTIEQLDGYTLHVLAHRKIMGYMRMAGLLKKLGAIRPDIVQATAVIGWIPLDAALYKPFLGYKLFTGNHMAASGLSLATRPRPWWSKERLQCTLTRSFPGRLASLATQKCYAVTEDCADIARKYFGVQPSKVELMYLGVDTEYFYPINSEAATQERKSVRERLGFAEGDVVCIYTGKLTAEKNVLLLAEAVDQLRSRGESFRGLFVGDGPQKPALETYASCKVLTSMPFCRLGAYYRSAEIGVWTGSESTSMLDGAACGIPVVISDRVVYRAPVKDNGRVFKQNDVSDLVRVLSELRLPETRKKLGSLGAARMAREFSWESVARRRLKDYEDALASERKSKQDLL